MSRRRDHGDAGVSRRPGRLGEELVPATRLEDADDPRADAYRALMGGGRPGVGDRLPGVFLAEGLRTVRLLLERSWPIESLLLSEARLAALGDVAGAAAARGATVYSAAQPVLDTIAGYNVHRGVLAVARRPAPHTFADVLAGAGRLVLGIEGVNDLENLGALFRNAAAFAVSAVLLDPTAADPLYRRAVRVSVGRTLTVPFARAERWPGDLDVVRAGGRRVLALTPDGRDTLDEVLAGAGPDDRWAVLVGAEGPGLTPAALDAADVTARIPIAAGVDSLNVATAAAIALHRLAGSEPTGGPGSRIPAGDRST